jgi:hypothetical protein
MRAMNDLLAGLSVQAGLANERVIVQMPEKVIEHDDTSREK